MKKWIVCLLLISLLLSGCGLYEEKEEPLQFYYPVKNMDYSRNTSYLQAEPRDRILTGYFLTEILNQYLQGPRDQLTYDMPFQYNTRAVSISIDNGIMDLTLSRGFATYSGLELTIACACIAKTVMSITGVDIVRIRADQTALDGAEYIEMDANSVLLIDNGMISEE